MRILFLIVTSCFFYLSPACGEEIDHDLSEFDYSVSGQDLDSSEEDIEFINDDTSDDISYIEEDIDELRYDFEFANRYDIEAEAQIFAAIDSETFSNIVVNYRYEDGIYPIRIIHNPKNELLFGEHLFFENPVRFSTIVLAELPLILARHLEELIPELCLQHECDIDLRTHVEYVYVYGDLHPVEIGETIDAFDESVEKIFYSDKFVNEVRYYFIENKYYKVRFVYNPKKKVYKAFHADYIAGQKRNFSLTWKYKYGIVVDQKASKKFVDHLWGLAHASWWDSHFNFSLENGTKFVYQEVKYNYNSTTTLTYTFDPLFHVMKNLILQP